MATVVCKGLQRPVTHLGGGVSAQALRGSSASSLNASHSLNANATGLQRWVATSRASALTLRVPFHLGLLVFGGL